MDSLRAAGGRTERVDALAYHRDHGGMIATRVLGDEAS